MRIKRGDIYWIEQNKYRPTVGCVQQPGRPGIVVSNDANNEFSLTLEIVYLTGKPKKHIPTHCTINSVPKPGIALCEQVTTVSTEQIREYIGHCSKEEMAEIDRCIAISLGLPTLEEELAALSREIVESAIIVPGEYDQAEDICDMKMQLAAATARADQLQKMYDSLLLLTMNKD